MKVKKMGEKKWCEPSWLVCLVLLALLGCQSREVKPVQASGPYTFAVGADPQLFRGKNAAESWELTTQKIKEVHPDFFVVCGFLVWFLAGIFASSVLDNDAIQIAFNGVFESLVQPALGILMLAALADAVSKQDDEQE